MCTVLLPPGGYPIAVNKYIISYIIPFKTTHNPPQEELHNMRYFWL